MYSFAHLRHTSVWLMTAKSAVLQKGHKEVDKIITLFIKWLLNQSQGVLLKLKHNENKTLEENVSIPLKLAEWFVFT